MIEDKPTGGTPLKELGEFDLIERITQPFSNQHKSTQKGIGDDSAVLKSVQKQVISTDLFTENIHFNLQYTPLKHLGYKCITSSISDVCAMNATPKQVLVSIAVSNRFTIEAIDEIYAGISAACKNYKLDLIGGDTTSSHAGLIISVTAIGENSEDSIVYRNGAKENDLLVVSGDLGAAYFGLQILERENQVWKVNPQTQPDLSEYHYLLQRQLRPEARTDVLALFEQLRVIPTSMIDVSDGLASEILHLSKQSKVGFTVYEEKLPMDQQVISSAEDFQMNPVTSVLNGGEDYELLFTIPLEEREKIQGNPNLSIIGHAQDLSSGNSLIGKGRASQTPIEAQGWKA